MNAAARARLPSFVAWVAVGAGYAFGVLAILSIGVFVLSVAVVATIVLVSRPLGRAGVAGLVSGLGLPLLYVAFLNRAGPGTVCTATATSRTCSDEWNPWTWLVVGIAFLVLGCILFWLRGRE